MELNVGDYVRTKTGQIHKITDLKGYYENDKLIEDRQYVYIDNHFSGWDLGQFKELIINSSPNIINLIEVGDYVNDYYVEDITNTGEELVLHIITGSNYFQSPFLYNEDIKSVLTHEQFEVMQYVVGDN